LAAILAGMPVWAQAAGTCKVRVTGDVAAIAEMAQSDKKLDPDEEVAGADRAETATDYWSTLGELRATLAATVGAPTRGGAPKSSGEMGDPDPKQGGERRWHDPADVDRKRKVDEAMKKDPRVVLLLITCHNATVRLTLAPSARSRYADVPFKPGRYRIARSSKAQPGDFTAVLSVASGGKPAPFEVSDEGEIELTQFDARGIKGTFSFEAKQSFGQDRSIKAAGSFSATCRGGNCER
jgi:hypothetical protein